jgi:hypothetical protein
MHFMLRGLSLTWLLFASASPALAMDPSAMEETNCLMACDANQEHCAGSPQVSARRNYTQVRIAPSSPGKSSLVTPPRRTSEQR